MLPRTAGLEMCETSLAETWAEFEQLRVRLTRYLRSSETEFVHLIQALDACWSMAESVQRRPPT